MRIVGLLGLLLVLAEAGVGAADLRVVSYNVEGLGDPSSTEYGAVVDVLARLDADVVLLQGLSAPQDLPHLDQLATDTGYGAPCVTEPTDLGSARQAAISRVPIAACHSHAAHELTSDPLANDLTGQLLEVQLQTDPDRAAWGVVSMELFDAPSRDEFRREVESRRVAQAVAQFSAEHPGSPLILVGSVNEDVARGPFGLPAFAALPIGLPATYRLGSDIQFPLAYDPFAALEAPGWTALALTHEESPLDLSTQPATGDRLEYVWLDLHLQLAVGEVYDACDDDGVDSPPLGDVVAKAGLPLACGTTANASSRLPLVLDLDRIAIDQDADGLEDGEDCAALDPDQGRPTTIDGLRADRLPDGTVRFAWESNSTADRYELSAGSLPGPLTGAVCRTGADTDSGDTLFDDVEPVPPGAGHWLLVQGVDSGCGGAGDLGVGSDGTARPLATCAPDAFFCVTDGLDSFTLWLNDSSRIQQARDLLQDPTILANSVGGNLLEVSFPFNPWWSFAFDPTSVYFFENAIEACDASIAWVDANGAPVGSQWCPWGSRLLRELDPDAVGSWDCGPGVHE